MNGEWEVGIDLSWNYMEGTKEPAPHLDEMFSES
jgi:hypothetical protein